MPHIVYGAICFLMGITMGILHLLSNAIDEFLARNELSLSMVRGQGYDVASNMRGEFNGLKAFILKENEHAYYVHCLAHQLQLVIVSSVSQNGLVSNFFEYLSMIVNIVGILCKRRDELRHRQFDDLARYVELSDIAIGKGMNQEMNLARVGDIRWGSHFKTITRLFNLWYSVKGIIEIIATSGSDVKSRGLAVGLFV
ncbi:uncharacterized protein LOC127264360 [Andrographis paniculata]|uniref:uncharacterized protein LOC127264360 n=1 Tax=Andrographis paniculata TaxID=175694 RepID=UPI0021E85405|nr:uncharacterized protein LOC127264360 [Andrographis paniculata]